MLVIAEPQRSAVSLDLLLVDLRDLIKREEQGLHEVRPEGSLGQLPERLSILLVRPLLGLAELFPPDRGFRRRSFLTIRNSVTELDRPASQPKVRGGSEHMAIVGPYGAFPDVMRGRKMHSVGGTDEQIAGSGNQ